jgi:hypothetical protein
MRRKVLLKNPGLKPPSFVEVLVSGLKPGPNPKGKTDILFAEALVSELKPGPHPKGKTEISGSADTT